MPNVVSKKIDLERDFATGDYLSESPPLLVFCLGWCSNFVGSESGQKQNMVYNTTQRPPLPSSHTLSVSVYKCRYCTLTLGRGGGVGEVNHREGLRGSSSQSWVENTNMTECISSL
jgi:hypothetical protein